jgi:hypothetical protein
MIIKKETNITERYFCSNCNSELEDIHFDRSIPKRCSDCGIEICPRCSGYYNVEVSQFRGCFGNTLPIKKLCRVVCLECGIKFEAQLVAFGLKVKVKKEEVNEIIDGSNPYEDYS